MKEQKQRTKNKIQLRKTNPTVYHCDRVTEYLFHWNTVAGLIEIVKM